jgi:hypothetical protein
VLVSDGNGGSDTQSIAITVTDVNDAPVAADDAYTATEDTPLAVGAAGVLANDLDEDGTPLVVTLVSGPASGTVTLSADGSFVYVPGTNFIGTDSFRYRVSDGALASGTATVTITVDPANLPPTAADGSVSSTAGMTYVFTIADFGYADQDGDALAWVTITSLPAEGVLTLNGAPVTASQDILAADIAAGRLLYVAPTNGVTAVSFGFRVHDGTAYAAAANTMTIGVVALADPAAPPGDPGGGTGVTPPVASPGDDGDGPADGGPGVAGGEDDTATGGGRAAGGGGDGGDGGVQAQLAAAESGEGAPAAVAGQPTVAVSGPSSGAEGNALILGTREGGLETLQVSDGSAHEGPIEAEMKAIEALAAPELRDVLDKLREEQTHEAAAFDARIAGSVMVVSSGLSVGYVLWLLRGGVLLSSLLTSLPAWRLIDPLPVLGRVGGSDDEDDDSLEDMVETGDADEPAGTPARAPRGA